jgi:hypothetical protein
MCRWFVIAAPFADLARWLVGNFDEELAESYGSRYNISPKTSKRSRLHPHHTDFRCLEYSILGRKT